jgi:ABC-type nitrate/sulfonate/bicarbonate transport system ATPase subunit
MTLLKQFKLESKANAYPHELSGGMRQRGAFLRTMLADAEILLLDEPFGALDVLTRNEIQDFLLELKQSWNKTALMVTHDLDEALYLSDRIIVLNGNPASVCANISLPKEKRTREWLYSQNELRMKLHELLKHA